MKSVGVGEEGGGVRRCDGRGGENEDPPSRLWWVGNIFDIFIYFFISLLGLTAAILYIFGTLDLLNN